MLNKRKIDVTKFARLQRIAEKLKVDPAKLTDYLLESGLEVIEKTIDEMKATVKNKLKDYLNDSD